MKLKKSFDSIQKKKGDQGSNPKLQSRKHIAAEQLPDLRKLNELLHDPDRLANQYGLQAMKSPSSF